MKPFDKYLAIGIASLSIALCLVFALIPQYPPHQWGNLIGPGINWGLYKFQYTIAFKSICIGILLSAAVLLWRERRRWSLRKIERPLIHIGLWLLVGSLFIGSQFRQQFRCQINTETNTPTYYNEKLEIAHLPFRLQLIESSNDSVKIAVQSQYHWFELFTISAQAPLTLEGYDFYLIKTSHEPKPQATLQIIDDPLGFLAQWALYILTLGLVIYGVRNFKWHRKLFLYLFGISAIAFLAIQSPLLLSPANERLPILRSPWLFPHVISYMLAYAVMSLSFIDSIVDVFRKTTHTRVFMVSRLPHLGLAFLALGCVLGALWAKDAWGAYWSWDPKEAWALMTIALYAILNHAKFKSAKTFLIWQALGFICLQMCWWGLNYLNWMPGGWHQY